MPVRNNGGPAEEAPPTPRSPASSRPMSPQGPPSVASGGNRHSSPSHRTSPSSSSHQDNGAFAPPVEEPDPDAQLLVIIGHISSETTGALHKEGITELHHFLKAYPHKRPRVDKMLESTGAAFRKYITRALASRAAEDQERDVAVADTLSKLESNHRSTSPATATEPQPRSPKQATTPEIVGNQDKLSRLHNLFQYRSKTLGIARQIGVQPDADPPGFWADLDRSDWSESQVSTDTPTKSEVQPTASDPTNSSMETDRSPRQRKASLTDGVPVRRIAAVDPAEQFEDVTQSLNDKISNKKREKTPT
ncbi:hypothetical protein DFH06DRAFT_1472778 [Mycena polygramma]|nr:hypothetical protein DFH06DRAFT_1472778 [Mycena polygramma]